MVSRKRNHLGAGHRDRVAAPTSQLVSLAWNQLKNDAQDGPIPVPEQASTLALRGPRPGRRPVLEDPLRRQLAGRAHDAAAGMRPRPALVVAVDRRGVLAPAGGRPEEVHLRREELAGEDVALGQADRPLDVERRPDLALEDEVAEAREERLEGRLDGVAQPLLLGVPVAPAQVVRRVLDEAAHDRLAGWRHVRVDHRLDRAVEIRLLRVPAVLGVVVGALEVLHRRPDVGEPAVLVGPVAERRIARHPVEREVDLGRGALEPEALDRVDEVGRQLARLDELEEGPPRVERRDDDRRVELGPVGQGHAGRPAVGGDDVVDRRLEPDLHPERLGGPREHLGEPAVAALVERPRPELAVVLAEDVIQQDEPGALRVRTDLGADDRGRREVALQDVRLEVVVEEVGGAAGQQPDGVVEDLLVEPLEPAAEVGQRDELLGVVAEDVRRRLVEQRLDRLEDLVDVVVERVVRVGVVRAVAGDLLLVLGVILAHQQVVAVLLRAERRRHQDRHEAVLDQLEVLDDVGPEQAERIRERREPEARPQLLGDRRATDEVAALEDERAQPGLGQVGAVGQAVVAAADDDRVVGPVGLRPVRGRL